VRADGLWHPRLLSLLAAAGHGDLVVIADAGLPVPPGVEVIDLVWRRGEPRLLPVLDAVLGDLVVERADMAAELRDPVIRQGLADLLGGPPATMSHDDLKRLTGTARVVVRTGEVTPYANVVLHAGVPF
jgi:D-ribose pyranase